MNYGCLKTDTHCTLTVQEVAKILRIARGGVYELIRSGQLRSFRCGHQYRITPQALDEFMGRAG